MTRRTNLFILTVLALVATSAAAQVDSFSICEYKPQLAGPFCTVAGGVFAEECGCDERIVKLCSDEIPPGTARELCRLWGLWFNKDRCQCELALLAPAPPDPTPTPGELPEPPEEPGWRLPRGSVAFAGDSLLVSLGEGSFISVTEIERLEAAVELAFGPTPVDEIESAGFPIVKEVGPRQ